MEYRARSWPNLAAMTAAAAETYGERTALIDGDSSMTFTELYEAARTFGAALVANGVRSGDRVAIWCPNSRPWVVAVLGILQAGATLVPISTRFKGVEAADMLARGKVRVLVTVSDFLGNDYAGMLRRSGVPLPDLDRIVIASGQVSDGAVGWDAFVDGVRTTHVAEVDRRTEKLGPDDPSDILFTSGTTGVPKGVVMSHSQTMAVATDWVDMVGMVPGDRYLMVNPYFHMFGLKGGILACVAGGATMLPLPVLDVDRALAMVASHGITLFPGPPTVYQAILDHEKRDTYDLSSLRVAVTGAADIPVELIRRVMAELPFRRVISGYGLTEGGTASSTGPDDDAETIATTVGRPRPGFEVRVTDPDGRDLPHDEVGEIVMRGPSVMTGYLDDAAATEAVLSPDGWLRTGDLGSVDEKGRLRITGRSKDMFIVGGFNAYPAEIESILMRNPSVRQVAVIGVPDQRLGEVAMAFVVPRAPTTPEAVIAWSRENMANYKVPRMVRLVDKLPINASGKVQKTDLRPVALESIRAIPTTDS